LKKRKHQGIIETIFLAVIIWWTIYFFPMIWLFDKDDNYIYVVILIILVFVYLYIFYLRVFKNKDIP